MLYQSWSE